MTNLEENTYKKNRFNFLIAAHPAIQETKKQREARLSAGLSLVAFLWTLMGIISVLAVRGFDTPVLLSVLPLLIAYFIAYIICRTPYYIQGIIFLVVAGSANTIAVLSGGVENIASTLFGAITLIFVIGTSILSTRNSIILVLLNVLSIALLPIFSTNITPGEVFRDLLTLLFFGLVLIVTASSRTNIETERLEEEKENNRKLKVLSDKLEEHIEILDKRSNELEIQSSYLKGAAEVSRSVATFTDTEILSKQVVELIKDNLNLYYVGIFLVDENEKWANLRAGTGKAGEIMLANKHRLKIGEGMIGWAIKQKKARIALDVGADATQFENPALPNTRSEAAIPLRSRRRVLGAITVQSSEKAAFTPEIISTLQTMADQIASAFDNAKLLAQSEAALKAERLAYGEMNYKAWQNLAKTGNIPTYAIGTDGEVSAFTNNENETLNESVRIEEDGFTALIPIKSHKKILGGIRIAKNPQHGAWSKEEIALAETLADELSVALESARLFEESQLRATREKVISETSTRIRETLDIESVLKTAAQELHKILGEVETEVWLDAE